MGEIVFDKRLVIYCGEVVGSVCGSVTLCECDVE